MNRNFILALAAIVLWVALTVLGLGAVHHLRTAKTGRRTAWFVLVGALSVVGNRQADNVVVSSRDKLIVMTPASSAAEAVDIRIALDDGTEYLFTLREGVTFHNGEPFSADDVVFSSTKMFHAYGLGNNLFSGLGNHLFSGFGQFGSFGRVES